MNSLKNRRSYFERRYNAPSCYICRKERGNVNLTDLNYPYNNPTRLSELSVDELVANAF